MKSLYAPHCSVLFIFNISIFVGMFLIFGGCYPRLIYCGQNKTNPKLMYKSPNHRYQETEGSFKLRNNSAISLSDSLGNRAIVAEDLEIGSELTLLRDKLDNNSIRFSELLYRAAEAYNQNVCSSKAETRYFALLDSTASYLFKIADLESQLEKAIGATNSADSINNSEIFNTMTEMIDSIPRIGSFLKTKTT